MDIISLILVFLAGALLGFFLNILVIRIPKERGLSLPLHCTRCGQKLSFWQCIPIFGWLIQRGRARCCNRSLHWIPLAVELLTAITVVLLYQRYGLTPTFAYFVFVVAVLIMTAAIDWIHRLIYTFFILIPALIAVLGASLIPVHSMLNAFLGALMAGFGFVLMFILARFLFPAKAAPFGLGDVYLGIFIGAAVGLLNLMPALFYGILMAGIFSAVLVIMKYSGRPNVPEYIAYGTFLCLGAIGYLLVGDMSLF
ncbi:MAG: prepilin peptidase [Chloroflexota bacterium]